MNEEYNKINGARKLAQRWQIVVLLLVVLSIFLFVDNLRLRSEVSLYDDVPELLPEETKVLTFMSDYVDLVLGSSEEMGIEDRLKLENGVRVIGDQELLSTWQDFTDSSEAIETQNLAISILRQLIGKLK